MPELRVRDCMHEGVIACPLEATLEEIAEQMRARRISALVVVRDGVAVGVISQTDLVNASFVQPYLRYWRGLTARHLMSAPVISVERDAPLREAVSLLQRHRIHRLVVTEPTPVGEWPVGVLSLTDIVGRLGMGPLAELEPEVTE